MPFTYSGYKLLAYANDRWLLNPAQWQADSPTVILRDSDSLRVELAASWSGGEAQRAEVRSSREPIPTVRASVAVYAS